MEGWTRGPNIGRGSTATVSLAVAALSGDLMAVKSTELSYSVLLQKEHSLLSRLNHPNIVKCIGSQTTHENGKLVYNLLLEYASGGTIYDMIQRCGGKLDESMVRSYTREILKGLDYLRSQGIVHCDVKSQNVLIRETGVAKIADLGCARLVSCGATSAFSGTPVFMAPEVARGEEQGFAADIWALGCMVIEMATGCSPWPQIEDAVAAMHRIGFSGDWPEIPLGFSGKAKDFLLNCLRREPKERWTAKELLEHPFLDETEESLCLKEVKMSCSPSTVLDQGFWDSCEMIQSHQNQIVDKDPFPSPEHPFPDCSNSSNYPADRITKLIKYTFSSMPDWNRTEDEWIPVRNNGTEETQKCYGDKNAIDINNSCSERIQIVLDSYEDELGSLDLNENDMLLEYYAVHRFNFYSTISDVDHLFHYENIIDDCASENINFQTDNNKSYCFVASQVLLFTICRFPFKGYFTHLFRSHSSADELDQRRLPSLVKSHFPFFFNWLWISKSTFNLVLIIHRAKLMFHWTALNEKSIVCWNNQRAQPRPTVMPETLSYET